MNKITISTSHPDAGRIYAEAYQDALKREDKLREALTDKREDYNKLDDRYEALQQRLTFAEQLLGYWYAANASGEIVVSDAAYKIVTTTAEIMDKVALKPASEDKVK